MRTMNRLNMRQSATVKGGEVVAMKDEGKCNFCGDWTPMEDLAKMEVTSTKHEATKALVFSCTPCGDM